MRWRRNDFSTPSKDDDNVWYDLIDDYDLIESSFLQQYGIRLRTVDMKWDEFSTLLSGLMPDTVLGNIVKIRSEDDPKVIAEFNSYQKKIRNEWRDRHLKEQSEIEYQENIRKLFNMALK